MQDFGNEFHDGKLLPMDALAVNLLCLEDMSELVANVPPDLAAELARMAARRALGMDDPFPKS